MESTEAAPSPQKQPPGAVWKKRAPAILLLGLLSFLYLKRQMLKVPEKVDVSALKLVDVDGAPLPDSLIKGRAVVLNFWAPWCPPCRIETPWLQKLQSAHPDKLLVVGVVADSDQYAQAAVFMLREGVSYPIVRESSAIDSTFGDVTALPTTYYISTKGKVLHTASGLIPELLMQQYVKDAIAN